MAACEQGSPSSCRVVHTLFAQGRTVQQNTPLSLYFRKRAQVYYAAALTRWGRQCKEGRAEACMNVGMTLRDGLGGERDASRAVAALHKAATLFKEGCTLRRVGADCYRAARVYTKGFSGVKPLAGERGFRKAKRALLLKMYRLGCELRSGEACHAYGELARTGKYMKKDLSLAKELYQKACSLLAPGILRKLSCTYAKGERPTLTRTPTK
ncbi:MAG: hypothetical protein CSA75_04375 [Sorangium cellulosum]|nr:MAG: hypothetical protein CSA75_04375 [Sorangium cellulosum]